MTNILAKTIFDPLRQSCKFAYPSVSRKNVKKIVNFWKISKLKTKIEIYKIACDRISKNLIFFEKLKKQFLFENLLKMSKFRLFLENLKIWFNLTENLKFLHNLLKILFFKNILAYPGYPFLQLYFEVRAELCDQGCYCPPRTGFGFDTLAINLINDVFNAIPNAEVIAEPISCPAGTYNDQEGIEREKDCTVCPLGAWCDGTISARVVKLRIPEKSEKMNISCKSQN